MLKLWGLTLNINSDFNIEGPSLRVPKRLPHLIHLAIKNAHLHEQFDNKKNRITRSSILKEKKEDM